MGSLLLVKTLLCGLAVKLAVCEGHLAGTRSGPVRVRLQTTCSLVVVTIDGHRSGSLNL